MSTAALVRAVVTVDGALPAEAQLGSLGRQITHLGSSGSASLTKMASAGKLAFAALGVAALVGIGHAIDKTVELAGENRMLARQLGVTVETASRLRVAGEELGIGVDKLSIGFGLFEKHLVNGGAAFEQYGIKLTDSSGRQKSFTALLGEAADKYLELGGGIKGTTLALDLFGRSGKTLIPLLAQGSAGIDELMKKADELGLVMSQKDVQAARALQIQQRELNEAFQGAEVSVGRIFIPLMTQAAHVLTVGVEVLNKVPGPVKAGLLAIVGLTGGLTALGLVVGIVTRGLTQLGILHGAAAVAATTQAAAETANAGALVLYIANAQGAVVATQEVTAASAEASAALGGGGLLGAVFAIGEGFGLAAGGAAAFAAGLGVLLLPLGAIGLSLWLTRKGIQESDRAFYRHSASVAQNRAAYGSLLSAYASSRAQLGLSAKELASSADQATAAEQRETTATRLLSIAHASAALQALSQRDAELALAGGLLGIQGAILGAKQAENQLHDARAAVKKDIADGKKGTQQYRDDLLALRQAELQAATSQLGIKQAVASYADTLLGPVSNAMENFRTAQENLRKLQADSKTPADKLAAAEQDVADAADAVKTAQSKLAPKQVEAIALIKDLGAKAGLSKGQIQDLIDKITAYTGKIKGVPDSKTTEFKTPGLNEALAGTSDLLSDIGKLHDKSITLATTFVRTYRTEYGQFGPGGASAAGGIWRLAGGGVLNAQGGLIARAPMLLGPHGPLVAEGGYATPWGKGTEAVVPLDSRGIGILAEALEMAFGKVVGRMSGAGGGRDREFVPVIYLDELQRQVVGVLRNEAEFRRGH